MTGRIWTQGFTLLEVVIALVVLEVAVVGVVGALALASATLTQAEVIERQVATTEGVLDSLARLGAVHADSIRTREGTISWVAEDSVRVGVRARDVHGAVIIDAQVVLPRP